MKVKSLCSKQIFNKSTNMHVFQNELIIQIMTESYEIDDLKRKVEDAKMKLLTEIKVTFFVIIY